MLQLATLLPSPPGDPIRSDDDLWRRVVEPFLRALGYDEAQVKTPGQLELRPSDGRAVVQLPHLAAVGRDGTRPLTRLLFHAPPRGPTAPDLLLQGHLERGAPRDFLDEAIACAARLESVPPLVAVVYPQRSGFVLAAFNALTRMPIGMTFPGPELLESLATGLRADGQRGVPPEGDVETLRAEIAHARAQADRVREAELLHALAPLLLSAQRFGEAREVLESLRGSSDLEAPTLQSGSVLLRLAGTCRVLGDAGAARVHLQQALEIYRQLREPLGEAATLSELAELEQQDGRLDAAIALLSTALHLARSRQAVRTEGAILNNLACALRHSGRLEEAMDALERSLELARQQGQPRDELLTQHNLAVVTQALGQEGVAERLVREVKRLSEALVHAGPAQRS